MFLWEKIKPIYFAGYIDKYITLLKANIFYLLEKFEVVGSCIVIELWHESGDFLDEHLSRLQILWCFLWVSSNNV